jgi:hypothetical protein
MCARTEKPLNRRGVEIGRGFIIETPVHNEDSIYQGHKALKKTASAITASPANAELENKKAPPLMSFRLLFASASCTH